MFAGCARFFLLLCIGICSCLLGLFTQMPLSARASVDPITVTSQSETVTFPKGIDFQMSAHDTAGLITMASLFIIYQDAGYQDQQPVKIGTPAQSVTLQWHLTITDRNFVPAGARIAYYWLLLDNAGNTHTDIQQSFSIQDQRFTWQHLSSGMLQVEWYNRPPAFGQAIFSQASDDIKHISGDLGGNLQHPITIWIYQAGDDFRGALPPMTYEWVGGMAFPSFNQALFAVDALDDDTLVRAMPHELTHLIFHQLTGHGTLAPRWFDEGLAVYYQIYHEPGMAYRFKEALTKHALLRLNTLEMDFPADADQAFLAYAQSWNLVDYMYATFGTARMNMLVKAMHDDQQGDFDRDLNLALGMDEVHLENQWRLHLGQPAILSATDLPVPTTVPASRPVTVPVVKDNSLPLLLLLSMLLVLLPIIGLGYLFAYQARMKKASYYANQPMQRGGESRLLTTSAQLPIVQWRERPPAPAEFVGYQEDGSLPYTSPQKYGEQTFNRRHISQE